MNAVGFSADELTRLRNLHTEVFGNFRYQTDQLKHKTLEFWEHHGGNRATLGTRKFTGDCEEFAMITLYRAMEQGFSGRLVFCFTEQKEGHCISEVISKDGKQAMYFDNRRRTLVRRGDLTGYEFVTVSPMNPRANETRKWNIVKR